MDPYISMIRGQYSSADVARELQRGQDFYRKDALGSDFLALDNSQQEQHYLASMRNSVAHPDFLPMGGQHQPAPEAYGEQCLCGNFYTEDSAFCRKCGRRRAASQSPSPAATAAASAAANAAIRASLTSQDMGTPFDTSSMLSPQELQRLYQDASDVQIKDGHMVSSKVIDKQEQKISKVVTGKRQIITVEKVVEVPQVITKETIKRVPKPEIVERIIEVPGKVELRHRGRRGPGGGSGFGPGGGSGFGGGGSGFGGFGGGGGGFGGGSGGFGPGGGGFGGGGGGFGGGGGGFGPGGSGGFGSGGGSGWGDGGWGGGGFGGSGFDDGYGPDGVYGNGMSGIGPNGLAIDYGGYGGGGIQDLDEGAMRLVGGPGSYEEAMLGMQGYGVDADGELVLPPGVEPGSKEYNEFLLQLEAQGLIEIHEEIVEVPQVVVEERVVHVPGRKQIQERLIEVPKVEWVERVEYEDFVEYREVPVDKIIEVPEIEYKVKQVDQAVPQTYVQEHFVDRYREVPVTQVQEVERTEHVPVMVPRDWQPPNLQAMGMAPAQQMVAT